MGASGAVAGGDRSTLGNERGAQALIPYAGRINPRTTNEDIERTLERLLCLSR